MYASLPFGPRVGLALARNVLGSWVLGPGLPLLAVGGAAAMLVLLWRRRAPAWAYAAIAGAGACYAVAFSSLRAAHLERTHLPEYGIVACLAWRAVAPVVPGTLAGYVVAAGLAAAIGWGDELLQRITPGRYYDVRDVAMNALGAVLAIVVLAAARAGRTRHKAVAAASNAEIATARSGS